MRLINSLLYAIPEDLFKNIRYSVVIIVSRMMRIPVQDLLRSISHHIAASHCFEHLGVVEIVTESDRVPGIDPQMPAESRHSVRL